MPGKFVARCALSPFLLGVIALLGGVALGTWSVPATGTTTDTAADTGAPTDTGPTGTGDTATGTPTDTGVTTDTGIGLDLDGDRDGWTPREGDCDDANADAHPGLPEVCADRADNDCDGLYDEGCDETVRFASLRGGGGCTGGSGIAGTQAAVGPAALLLLLLPLWSFPLRGPLGPWSFPLRGPLGPWSFPLRGPLGPWSFPLRGPLGPWSFPLRGPLGPWSFWWRRRR